MEPVAGHVLLSLHSLREEATGSSVLSDAHVVVQR